MAGIVACFGVLALMTTRAHLPLAIHAWIHRVMVVQTALFVTSDLRSAPVSL